MAALMKRELLQMLFGFMQKLEQTKKADRNFHIPRRKGNAGV